MPKLVIFVISATKNLSVKNKEQIDRNIYSKRIIHKNKINVYIILIKITMFDWALIKKFLHKLLA